VPTGTSHPRPVERPRPPRRRRPARRLRSEHRSPRPVAVLVAVAVALRCRPVSKLIESQRRDDAPQARRRTREVNETPQLLGRLVVCPWAFLQAGGHWFDPSTAHPITLRISRERWRRRQVTRFLIAAGEEPLVRIRTSSSVVSHRASQGDAARDAARLSLSRRALHQRSACECGRSDTAKRSFVVPPRFRERGAACRRLQEPRAWARSTRCRSAGSSGS